MTAVELFLRVIRAFQQLNISYVTVGSFAANVYMDPRSTKDADFVLEMEKTNLSELVAAIGSDFVLDPQMSMESVTLTTRYKLTHRQAVFEIELFGLSSDAHDQERFKRRTMREVNGIPVYILTAEDVIITKLRWAVRSRRKKDREDAQNVIAGQAGNLDLPYIRSWCDQHGTRELFEQLYQEAKPFEQA
jgi:hypothetical protein